MRVLAIFAITATIVFLGNIAFQADLGLAMPMAMLFCGTYILVSKKKVVDVTEKNKNLFIIVPVFCFVAAVALTVFEILMIMRGPVVANAA